jgi:hypothetical protein
MKPFAYNFELNICLQRGPQVDCEIKKAKDMLTKICVLLNLNTFYVLLVSENAVRGHLDNLLIILQCFTYVLATMK